MHPCERVVRQAEGVELIQLMVIRNMELKLEENMEQQSNSEETLFQHLTK